jgi:hypothetical protein
MSEADGDPGDPSASPGAEATALTSPPATEVSAAEAELAARIPPVLGDEDATDEAEAIDPSRADGGAERTAAPVPSPAVPAGSQPAANPWASTFGKWCGVAFLLAAVAVLSRMAMRSSGAA